MRWKWLLRRTTAFDDLQELMLACKWARLGFKTSTWTLEEVTDFPEPLTTEETVEVVNVVNDSPQIVQPVVVFLWTYGWLLHLQRPVWHKSLTDYTTHVTSVVCSLGDRARWYAPSHQGGSRKDSCKGHRGRLRRGGKSAGLRERRDG